MASDDVGYLGGYSPPPASQLPSAFRPYNSSTSSAMGIDISAIAFSAGASSSTDDPPLHESVLRKLRRSAKRSLEKTVILRRSSWLAAKEPSHFTNMTSKVVQAHAVCLTATDAGKALKDAIRITQPDIPEALPASAAALAKIAVLYGADAMAATSVAHADNNNDDGGADVVP
ncbi:hypothetical protein D1007_15022 [Hordeum vulgare]|nr:hypothetical protein D1007_15022 [Hordeum vulgare]